MEGLDLTCTHSNICLGTWYVSRVQIKKLSSPRELGLRGEKLPIYQCYAPLRRPWARQAVEHLRRSWLGYQVWFVMVSSKVLVMYYCKSKKDLNTTNGYVFCGTGSF